VIKAMLIFFYKLMCPGFYANRLMKENLGDAVDADGDTMLETEADVGMYDVEEPVVKTSNNSSR
jgi:hypothetical protein